MLITGRVRKKTKFFHFMDEEGDGNSSEGEEVVDEYQPDSEPEEPGETTVKVCLV
jgi:hypothetical protein